MKLRMVLLEFDGTEGGVMPDTIEEYLNSWEDDNNRRSDDRTKARFVAQAGQQFFADIWKAVQSDLAVFQKKFKDPTLRQVFDARSAFTVSRDNYPQVKLEVALSIPHVVFTRHSRVSSRSEETEDAKGCILLESDLKGNIQASYNGNVLPDYKAISRFLLVPLFEYLRIHR